ncbi:hypothetical protein ACFVAV_05985 [Nocardia sp. NPDC057663]|uniref:hypothetical protein n=1 Tax=Nocardia sp. NPDC057663 TaxID=3346201 RepID=UPI0036709297
MSPEELEHLQSRAALYLKTTRWLAGGLARNAADPHERKRFEALRDRVNLLLYSDQVTDIDVMRQIISEYPEVIDQLYEESGEDPNGVEFQRINPDNPAGYIAWDGGWSLRAEQCPPGMVFDPEATDVPFCGRGLCVPISGYDPTDHPDRYRDGALNEWVHATRGTSSAEYQCRQPENEHP